VHDADLGKRNLPQELNLLRFEQGCVERRD